MMITKNDNADKLVHVYIGSGWGCCGAGDVNIFLVQSTCLDDLLAIIKMLATSTPLRGFNIIADPDEVELEPDGGNWEFDISNVGGDIRINGGRPLCYKGNHAWWNNGC